MKERDILKRCTLFREGNVWKGVHPVRLDGACDLRDWEGRVVSRIGTPTGRGTCAYEVNGASGKRMEERAIGDDYYMGAGRKAPGDAWNWHRVCLNPALSQCFQEVAAGDGGPGLSDLARAAFGFGRGMDDERKGHKEIGEALEAVADGKVSLTDLSEEMLAEAQRLYETAKDREAVKEYFRQKLNHAKTWMNKPSGDKWEDIGHAAGGELADAAITGPAALAGGGAAVGGVKEVAEHATAHAAKKAAKKAANHTAKEATHELTEEVARAEAKHAPAGRRGQATKRAARHETKEVAEHEATESLSGGVEAKAEKAASNPHGSDGAPDHREKVNELFDRTEKAYGNTGHTVQLNQFLPEKRNGLRRRPDVAVVDSEGKTVKVIEVGRTTSSGQPKSRERKKFGEYERHNNPNEFHGLTPKPKKGP